ncbi:hypothetical protein BpHYR1_042784, partial [Brachionus plicatilis]
SFIKFEHNSKKTLILYHKILFTTITYFWPKIVESHTCLITFGRELAKFFENSNSKEKINFFLSNYLTCHI